MNLLTKRRIAKVCTRMLDRYCVDNDSLPMAVVANIERPTIGNRWHWQVKFVYDPSKRRPRDPFLYSGDLYCSEFDGSVTCENCKSEKDAAVQASYAKELLEAGLKQMLVLVSYRELR